MIGWFLFTPTYRTRRLDADRLPHDGPLLLVANHAGYLDGPLAFTVTPRPSHFLVKKDMFTGPLGLLLRFVGQIPIDRSVGDRSALGTARAILAAGGAVGIFPEGTRGRGDVAEVNQGAAWLALQTSAQIVPVAILGTRVATDRDALAPLWSRLVVAYGEPFDLARLLDEQAGGAKIAGRDKLRLGSEALRMRLAEHVQATSAAAGVALPPSSAQP